MDSNVERCPHCNGTGKRQYIIPDVELPTCQGCERKSEVGTKDWGGDYQLCLIYPCPKVRERAGQVVVAISV
jgi:hypothetical protein